MAISSQRVAAG
ncbi:hypothetical protein YPPY32_3464, partial [Yersinia pestis PY-32]